MPDGVGEIIYESVELGCLFPLLVVPGKELAVAGFTFGGAEVGLDGVAKNGETLGSGLESFFGHVPPVCGPVDSGVAIEAAVGWRRLVAGVGGTHKGSCGRGLHAMLIVS